MTKSRLPAYFYPLVESVKINQKATMLSKIASYNGFIENVKKRQTKNWNHNFGEIKNVTVSEQNVLTVLQESQVVVPETLTYGDVASHTLAELFYETVLNEFSGLKDTTVTVEGEKLLNGQSPVQFNRPAGTNDIPVGTGMVLDYFNKSKILRLKVDWGLGYLFEEETENKITEKYGVSLNFNKIFSWLDDNPQFFRKVSLGSSRFWWGPFLPATVTVLGSIVMAFVLVTIFFGFVAAGVAFLMSLLLSPALMVLVEEGVVSPWSKFWMKATPKGVMLAEELLPWERFVTTVDNPETYQFEGRETKRNQILFLSKR